MHFSLQLGAFQKEKQSFDKLRTSGFSQILLPIAYCLKPAGKQKTPPGGGRGFLFVSCASTTGDGGSER
ncbi:hypothetical protein ERY430_40250 [Erythrobacter sp. EC-HK427]|nr:hypothetical protein ERY430_40250 [Erythrobacter sp. EC-HK427]